MQFRIHGPDADTLRRTAEDVATALRATPGTRDIQFSWGERAPGCASPSTRNAWRSSASRPASSRNPLQGLLSGTTATQLREGNRLVDVVRPRPGRTNASRSPALGDLTISTPAGPSPSPSSRGWSR